MPFTIIHPTPGPTTTQKIRELIFTHPQGITVKKLSNLLNRPVSMIQCCLKSLLAVKVIEAKRPSDTQKWVYYPASVPPLKSN
ncbi:winged helix-turn-helix domain-containing protein [Cyanobacterium sp. uoEpiScrs1]|uniref:winged helix-turn-helix domain-containing protein n=1 Tax=Cyanobacterium sp. uoEpiScrs1 TaxID=2976343 RepID=UPI00226AAF12|nr:winged helix-turn-helix domain-containing protein [Cyanobacterium sp. uoEpiScrs1]